MIANFDDRHSWEFYFVSREWLREFGVREATSKTAFAVGAGGFRCVYWRLQFMWMATLHTNARYMHNYRYYWQVL